MKDLTFNMKIRVTGMGWRTSGHRKIKVPDTPLHYEWIGAGFGGKPVHIVYKSKKMHRTKLHPDYPLRLP